MNRILFLTNLDNEKIKRNSGINLLFFILFLLISFACFALVIILSSYETRVLWMIFGSFLIIVPLIISLCFYFKRKHQLDSAFLYSQLLESNGEEIKGVISSISEESITLQNGFEVYIIKINCNDNIRSVYLFANKLDLMKIDLSKTYLFNIVSGYLKEIKDA